MTHSSLIDLQATERASGLAPRQHGTKKRPSCASHQQAKPSTFLTSGNAKQHALTV